MNGAARGFANRPARLPWILVGVLVAISILPLGGAVGAPMGCTASISRVSAISAANYSATFVVHGRCLGQHPTYIATGSYYPGHTGWDTNHCGRVTTAALALHDLAPKRTWEAGVADNTSGPWPSPCSNVNGLGLFYFSWNSTTIVIHGFGNRLQSCGSSSVSLCKGDPLQLVVYKPYSAPGATFALRAT